MAKYQGHRSWNSWNVALWIGNDEPLYRLALDCIKRGKTVERAARLFLSYVEDTRTPDGARYNITCIREAIAGLME